MIMTDNEQHKAQQVVEEMLLNKTKPKRRGRPKGSKNKSKKIIAVTDKQYENQTQEIPTVSDKKYICLCCGKESGYKQFYKSHSKIHAGNDYLLPICKTCLEKLYRELESKYTKEIEESESIVDENYIDKQVIKRICMMNDIYYNDSLFEAALKQSSSHTMFSAYMKIVNLLQYRKKTYENTFAEEVSVVGTAANT